DNGFGPVATQSFTITVVQSPSFTNGTSATFDVGTASSFAVTTSPGSPASTTLTMTGELPDGVEFTPDGSGGGVLSGTPAAGTGGNWDVTFTATNGAAPDVTQA